MANSMGRRQWAQRPRRESLGKRLGRVAIAIKARDGNRCVYCASTAETSGAPLQLDHVLPRCKGGADVASNLVTACRPCNASRHDLPLATFCRIMNVCPRKIRRRTHRNLSL